MVEIKAYAKVNLFINVLDKREDGYHNLEMVNAKVDLYDKVTLKKNDATGVVLIKSNDLFLSNQNNIVFETASFMMRQYVPSAGLTVELDKKIPFGAGLAGNSTDAAAIIKGINELFNLQLSLNDMIEIGLKFGADIPYCLFDDFAIVEGIGEKITKIDFSFEDKQILLINPHVYIQTKDIFTYGDKHGYNNVDSSQIKQAIQNKDISGFIKNMHNALQNLSIQFSEDVLSAYNLIQDELGTTGLVMTGSGSTFIKIVDKNDKRISKFIDDYNEKYFMNIYNFL